MQPRLRGQANVNRGPWPLGQVPSRVIEKISRQLIFKLALGQRKVSGDDFADYFAYGVNGIHLNSPNGVADVTLEKCAWSAKTVQAKSPFRSNSVRLIAGRNSPHYSLGIDAPLADISATGDAVLSIWNQRVDNSLNEYADLRLMVLVRNTETQQFMMFEEELVRFPTSNYTWALNENSNLIGTEISTGLHRFTWQPHGAQFTMIREVPGSAIKFEIAEAIPAVTPDHILRVIRYDRDWVRFY